jgi:hypothetical protein
MYGSARGVNEDEKEVRVTPPRPNGVRFWATRIGAGSDPNRSIVPRPITVRDFNGHCWPVIGVEFLSSSPSPRDARSRLARVGLIRIWADFASPQMREARLGEMRFAHLKRILRLDRLRLRGQARRTGEVRAWVVTPTRVARGRR